ncbi:hypothetical protein AN641_08635 [Candidatus Epulonipiscioides gigas]|nr:hypothetical protein AN641_08635 [Epulopiscium sp. SCG-C07WGA-EpuloA2]
MDKLKELFSKEMLILYKQISKQIKYKSQNLLKYINEYGGYQAALKYIYTPSYTNDFSALWEAGRLDLSIEVLLLNEKYRSIIAPDVINFCTRRLNEYNYKPREIIQESPPSQEFVVDIVEKGSENMPIKKESPDNVYYTELVNISKQQWKELFLNDKIFTLKNKELILKMYNLGKTAITNEALKEVKFAYKEIITMLAKKIKNQTKIEVPISERDEALWWNILFLGNFQDNQHFNLVLNPNLYDAISEILAPEKLNTSENNIDKDANMLQEDIDTVKIEEAKEEPKEQEVNEELKEQEEVKTIENMLKLDEIENQYNKEPIKNINEEISTNKNISNKLNVVKNNAIYFSPSEKNIAMSHRHEIGAIGHIDNHLDRESHFNASPFTLVKSKKNNVAEQPPKKDFHDDDLDDDEKLDAFIDDFFADDDNEIEFEKEPSMEDLARIELERMLSNSYNTAPPPSAIQTMQRKPFEIKTSNKSSDLAQKKEAEAKIKWEELKQECLEYYGASCEICGTDYGYTYGDKFENLMDVYNTKAKEKNWDNLNVNPEKDLIPVCHNCNAIIHAKHPHYTVEEVKEFLKNK